MSWQKRRSAVCPVCTQNFHPTDTHKNTGSPVFVSKVTLATSLQGSLPYIFAGLLPLLQLMQRDYEDFSPHSCGRLKLQIRERKCVLRLRQRIFWNAPSGDAAR